VVALAIGNGVATAIVFFGGLAVIILMIASAIGAIAHYGRGRNGANTGRPLVPIFWIGVGLALWRWLTGRKDANARGGVMQSTLVLTAVICIAAGCLIWLPVRSDPALILACIPLTAGALLLSKAGAKGWSKVVLCAVGAILVIVLLGGRGKATAKVSGWGTTVVQAIKAVDAPSNGYELTRDDGTTYLRAPSGMQRMKVIVKPGFWTEWVAAPPEAAAFNIAPNGTVWLRRRYGDGRIDQPVKDDPFLRLTHTEVPTGMQFYNEGPGNVTVRISFGWGSP
jgi:hypothetical protein